MNLGMDRKSHSGKQMGRVRVPLWQEKVFSGGVSACVGSPSANSHLGIGWHSEFA